MSVMCQFNVNMHDINHFELDAFTSIGKDMSRHFSGKFTL